MCDGDLVVHGDVERLAAEDPFPGVRRRSFHSAQSTVAAYAFEPGAAFPLHRHDEEQITVIHEGEVEFEVAGERHVLGAGHTYVVAAGVQHGLRAGPSGARFLAVVVPRRARTDAYTVVS
jgi:quercetin dioxygenase-like cupin family protein